MNDLNGLYFGKTKFEHLTPQNPDQFSIEMGEKTTDMVSFIYLMAYYKANKIEEAVTELEKTNFINRDYYFYLKGLFLTEKARQSDNPITSIKYLNEAVEVYNQWSFLTAYEPSPNINDSLKWNAYLNRAAALTILASLSENQGTYDSIKKLEKIKDDLSNVLKNIPYEKYKISRAFIHYIRAFILMNLDAKPSDKRITLLKKAVEDYKVALNIYQLYDEEKYQIKRAYILTHLGYAYCNFALLKGDKSDIDESRRRIKDAKIILEDKNFEEQNALQNYISYVQKECDNLLRLPKKLVKLSKFVELNN